MNNTVNDVMNVIASPDYGIKSIAGTNHEILAILSGTHNSQNNIHVIVDDIKKLLQTLVTTSTEKKSIQIDDNYTKINHKNIKDILDETKGIRKAIDNLAKSILKQGKNNMPSVVKLSDKHSKNIAAAMIKNIEKQNKDGALSSIIDTFSKLKDISLKDIIFGNLKVKKIGELFKNAEKDLKIKKKDVDSIIKLINSAPEMIKSLLKVSLLTNLVIKNNTIQKLKDILIGEDSILSLSKTLNKNKKNFNISTEVIKDIKEIISPLSKIMRKLSLSAIWFKLANNAIKNISPIIDNIISLSKTLNKNKNSIKESKKASKDISILVGNLLIASIFLTMASITAGPAILGAVLLSKMVDKIIIVSKKLSKNNKHIAKAIGSSLLLTVFTGIIIIPTILLSAIAITGIPAILGSVLLLGIVAINVLTFKLLDSAKQSILIGSLVMALMSGALIVFGIALQKITDATKDVTWKQFGIIAATTVLLGLVVAAIGIPVVAGFIALGSVAMLLMSGALIVFGMALDKLAKATKDVSFGQVAIIAGSIALLGLATALVGAFSIAIIPGSIATLLMSGALIVFGMALDKLTKSTKDVSFIQVAIIAGSVALLGLATAFVGALSLAVIPGSIATLLMSGALIVFGMALDKLTKSTKDVPFVQIAIIAGSIALLGLATAFVGAFSIAVIPGSIALSLMSPALMLFGTALEKVSNATKNVSFLNVGETALAVVILGAAISLVGVLSLFISFGNKVLEPMSLTLVTFSESLAAISNNTKNVSFLNVGETALAVVILGAVVALVGYFFSDYIEDGAKSIDSMNKPLIDFCKTLVELSNAGKKMGAWSSGWYTAALLAIAASVDSIGEKKNVTIGAKSIDSMNKPLIDFCKTLVKASDAGKKMGAWSSGWFCEGLENIAEAVAEVGEMKNINAGIKNISTITNGINQFIDMIKKVYSFKDSPTKIVDKITNAFENIKDFFTDNTIEDDAKDNINAYKNFINKFIDMGKELYKINEYGNIRIDVLNTTLNSLSLIKQFFNKNYIGFFAVVKANNYKNVLKILSKSSVYLKYTIKDFTNDKYENTKLLVKSMTEIIVFLKTYSLYKYEIKRTNDTLNVLNRMAFTMKRISRINANNIFTVGNALKTTLNGVNEVDIDKIKSVTNMFDTFNRISKNKSFIEKFTESVKEFTEACENLMIAMGNNTDAINNIDSFGVNSKSTNTVNDYFINFGSNEKNENTQIQTNGVKIINVDEIAKTIAEKINGALSVDVPDTQVQLLINGTGGNEWTITRY